MSRVEQTAQPTVYSADGIPTWRLGLVAIAGVAIAIGLWLRWSGLFALDVFCRVPDEFSEVMPGLRLHTLRFSGLPFWHFGHTHMLAPVAALLPAAGSVTCIPHPLSILEEAPMAPMLQQLGSEARCGGNGLDERIAC